MNIQEFEWVSVPLRGLWFLSTREELGKAYHLPGGFRPLAGIMVLIKLPSIPITSSRTVVSVPLRGLWFLSIFPLQCLWGSRICFRPLAGIMVLILISVRPYKVTTPLFPSPCGDYGSYLRVLSRSSARPPKEFPSPCGDYGSYRVDYVRVL